MIIKKKKKKNREVRNENLYQFFFFFFAIFAIFECELRLLHPSEFIIYLRGGRKKSSRNKL